MKRWYQLQLPYFTAGIAVEGGRVVTAAPICYWTRGKTLDQVRLWVASKRGQVIELPDDIPPGTSGEP